MLKTASWAIILLCLFSASTVLATEYNTYDCDYFSVEYPSGWTVEKSMDAENEGWSYEFNRDGLGYMVIDISAVEVLVVTMMSVEDIENGSLNEQFDRFWDTLWFKNSNDQIVNENVATTYETYDSIYFDVEYPTSWKIDKVPFESYDGTIYRFIDNRNNPTVGVTFGKLRSADFISVNVLTPTEYIYNGTFEEPVIRFLDTLHFKV